MALGWSALSSRIFLALGSSSLHVNSPLFSRLNVSPSKTKTEPDRRFVLDSQTAETAKIRKGPRKQDGLHLGSGGFRAFFFHSRFVLSRSLEPGTVQPECFITSLVAQQPHGLLKRLGEGDRELIPWILGYSKKSDKLLPLCGPSCGQRKM